jgi:predicted transcriptional regulator
MYDNPGTRRTLNGIPRQGNVAQNERLMKGAIMTLQHIKDLLDAEILAGGNQMHTEVISAFVADMMSDLLAFGSAGSLLLTRMTSPQVIRTSDILDIAAIIMVRGKIPPPEVIQLAEELNVPILATRFLQFEAAGLLYTKGLRGNIDKADERHAAD